MGWRWQRIIHHSSRLLMKISSLNSPCFAKKTLETRRLLHRCRLSSTCDNDHNLLLLLLSFLAGRLKWKKTGAAASVIVGKALCPENDGALHMFAQCSAPLEVYFTAFFLHERRSWVVLESTLRYSRDSLFYTLSLLSARLHRTLSSYPFIARLNRTPSSHAFIARFHRTPSSLAFIARLHLTP